MKRLMIAGMVVLASAARAQTFDAASVKPSGPHSVRMFDDNPGRISFTRANLKDLLVRAYALKDFDQISGPGWLGDETYDIIATFPPGTTRDQVRIMLQNLLTERFRLAVHHETKDFPVYALVVARTGAKLNRPAAGKEGFPPLPEGRPGMSMSMGEGRARLNARQEPLSVLAGMLRSQAGRLVVDDTGLTGKYDFTLEFSLVDDDAVPDLFTAPQEQLGLKLEDRKVPFNVVVVDHAEKVPTVN